MHDRARPTELLFVYGTLRRGCRHRMHAVLAAASEFVAAATFRGRLYRVARYPGIVASHDPRDRVVGDVFRLAEPAAVLQQLDRYEGCDPRNPAAPYIRAQREVRLDSGHAVTTWIYLYNRSVDALERIGSGDFLAAAAGANRD